MADVFGGQSPLSPGGNMGGTVHSNSLPGSSAEFLIPDGIKTGPEEETMEKKPATNPCQQLLAMVETIKACPDRMRRVVEDNRKLKDLNKEYLDLLCNKDQEIRNLKRKMEALENKNGKLRRANENQEGEIAEFAKLKELVKSTSQDYGVLRKTLVGKQKEAK